MVDIEYRKTDRMLVLDGDSVLETLNIAHGLFDPLDGFQNEADYRSIVENMTLADGRTWAMPITLELPEEAADELAPDQEIRLATWSGARFANLGITGIFRTDPAYDVAKVFGTDDPSHPGVRKELNRSRVRVAGKILNYKIPDDIEYDCIPSQTKQLFADLGWKTIAGFQTRNPPHRAHEYLHRLAMEFCDGVFLHPLIGWKQKGDFTPQAVIEGYRYMVDHYYGPRNAFVGAFRTAMRYAGPREAVFHAQVRKNFGCTHFIIGRDHAGVGNFYSKYEAQQLADSRNDLGIRILKFKGPYYCGICKQVVTSNTCRHDHKNTLQISGTQIREMLNNGKLPPEEYMRPEIGQLLSDLARSGKAFCE